MKEKELGRKQIQGIENFGIEDSQGSIIANQKKVLKFWENYITELYCRANRPGNLEGETKEEVTGRERHIEV
jgi:hypothetical protein